MSSPVMHMERDFAGDFYVGRISYRRNGRTFWLRDGTGSADVVKVYHDELTRLKEDAGHDIQSELARVAKSLDALMRDEEGGR